ncbi:MAG TPA: hypothetical protein VFQ52_11560 [Rhizomicrobium sp.]|nr:hypothetical protein [Rhizomicrobium sp.]
MPIRQFIHVVGFEVPAASRGDGQSRDTLIVMLDKAPNEEWCAAFMKSVAELGPALLHEPPQLLGLEIRLLPKRAMTRALASDIRRFVDKINRQVFLKEGAGPPRLLL